MEGAATLARGANDLPAASTAIIMVNPRAILALNVMKEEDRPLCADAAGEAVIPQRLAKRKLTLMEDSSSVSCADKLITRLGSAPRNNLNLESGHGKDFHFESNNYSLLMLLHTHTQPCSDIHRKI